MLTIAGILKLDPAKAEEAKRAMQEMMAETRKEAGCNAYVFSADLDEAGVFRIFEEWESDAALQAHFAAPHIKAFQAKAAAFGVSELTVHRYEVSSKKPLNP